MQAILSPISALHRRMRLALVVGLALLAATAPALALPKVQKVMSPGGIEAWLMELHDAPLITFRLGFRGGVAQDPDGRYGTTAMTAYMFDEGAGAYDSAELKRRLVRIGGTLSATSNFEYFTVSFATPSVHKDQAFELLRLAIDAPRFDAEPMARARTYYLNGVEAAKQNPSNVAIQALRARVFGKHPMAVDFASQKTGYESVGADDIKAHRGRILGRDNLKIAVVGDIDAATLAPLLDRLLGSLPANASLRPVPVPAGAAGSCELTAMQVPQAVVQLASVTPRLTWRQRLAWWTLDAILNQGIAAGRLSRELREKRGLVYGVYTGYLHFTTFGVFESAFGAKMTEVPEALAILRQELRRMVAEGPTEEEVAAIKPSLVGKTLLGLDTGAAIANLLLNLQLLDQPASYLDDIAGEIERVTRQDVWEVAKLVLNPDRLAVSIAGPPGQAGAKACETPVAQR